MRVLYEIAVAFSLFILMINFAFYWIGNSLGIDSVANLSNNFLETNATIAAQVDGIDTSENAFNPALIFGDFFGAVNLFIDFISGGFILNTLQGFGFDIYFLTGIQVMMGALTLFSIIYLISGRQ